MIIVIPTYKEKKNIFFLTKKILKIFPKVNIYIVDDTENISLKKHFKNKRIKYFLRKNKKGRGSAVLYGFSKSLTNKSNKIFVEMDADFSHNPKELKRNISFFKKKNLDLLISSRYMENSKIVNWSIQRLLFSKLSNFLARVLLKAGVKLITKNCGKIGDGFIVLSEILLVIKMNNFKINEVPTVFINRKRGESSVNLKLILESFFGLLHLFLIKIKKN